MAEAIERTTTRSACFNSSFSTTSNTLLPAAGGAGGPPDGYTARQGTVRPRAAHFFDGAIHPDAYGAPLHGNCLAPEVNDGDMALASPSLAPVAGDFVVLYFASGAAPQMKRLVSAPPMPVGVPLHPDSDCEPLVMVEMLNPPRRLMAPISRIKAMHKVVGLIRRAEVQALRSQAIEPPKPRRRRKAGAA